MKSWMRNTVLAALVCAAASPAMAKNGNAGLTPYVQTQLAAVVTPLTAEEAATLAWMREEEKLARDVYQVLYRAWAMPAFQRIATSEQRHFEAIGSKLSLFGLADPALATPGQFSAEPLRVLYSQLIDSGLIGYRNALIVGATVEDMDIDDLMAALDDTDNVVLKRTYQNLLDGSKNHLRTFVGLLRGLGDDYVPQYIDPVLFDAIVGD